MKHAIISLVELVFRFGEYIYCRVFFFNSGEIKSVSISEYIFLLLTPRCIIEHSPWLSHRSR